MRRKRHSVTGKVLSSELNAMKNMYKHYTCNEEVVTNNKNKEEMNSESSEGNENNNEVVLSTGIKDNNNNGRYESEVISNEKVIHELSAELEQSAHKMDKFKSPEINVNVTENNNTKKNEDNTNINTNNNNSNINTNNNIKKNEDNTNINTNINSNINNNSNTKKNEDNNNVNNNNSNNSKVTPSNNTFVNKFNMTMNGNFKGNDGFINVFDIRKGQKDLDKKISNYNKKLTELEIYTKQKLIELANYFDQRNFTTNPQSKMEIYYSAKNNTN